MFVFLTITALLANVNAKEQCTGCIKVNSDCHNVSHVLDFQGPFRKTVVITKLGILQSKKIIYYAFEPPISDSEYSKVGYVYMDDPARQGIVETPDGTLNLRTFDFDQRNNVVYFGGSTAIYVLENANNKTAKYMNSKDNKHLFFNKNQLYLIQDGVNNITKKEGNEFKPLKPQTHYGNVTNFVINKNNVVVLLNKTGLYANNLSTHDSVYLSKNNYFRGLTVDSHGDVVYAWWVDGLYKLIIDGEIKNSRLDKIANIDNIGAVTFDADNNILFSYLRGLYRLYRVDNIYC